ncbi:MAG: FMN-binding protein [Clostridium sp.]|nr:FMN-binding protein [Clostridium sp.]
MKLDKDVKTMLKEGGILFAITLAAGLLLGFVYELTKEPIRLQEGKKIREACLEVFPGAAAFSEIDYVPGEEARAQLEADGVELGTVYEAFGADGASVLGYVLETISKEGYGGELTLYMGVTKDGFLNGISILEISETPALGMRAEEVLVPQFREKKAAFFTYTKTGSKSDSEIDAISGATVTTKAVTDAVNGGLKAAAELTGGEGS